MKKLLILSALLSALALSGCGDDKKSDSAAEPSAAQGTPVASSSSSDSAKAGASGKIIVLELPSEELIGTPVPFTLGHLAPGGIIEAPAIEIPDGVTNIAKGKEVTSSDDFPLSGELEFVTDGNKGASEEFRLELGPDPQWVQIDLGEKSEVYGIAVWHFHSQKRAYHDVVIQISDDPEFMTGVTTVFNNDHDNSSGLGKGGDYAYTETNSGLLVDAKKALGRYVRLYSNGNTTDKLNHYIEVEVFGKKAE